MDLKGRSFLTLLDFNKEEIRYMLDLAHELKAKKKKGILGEELKGKNIVLVFDKSSTRTRCSFEVAAMDEGAHVTYLTNSHMNKKESIEDTAKVFGRMYDAIEYRGFKQSTVQELADYAGVPVFNGLTDEFHPTQMLADVLTMIEHCDKPLRQISYVYIGDARNNMGNSLLLIGSKLGMDVRICGPKALLPEASFIEMCEGFAKESGARITVTEDIDKAVSGVDFVHTDVWVSMGEPLEAWGERIKLLLPYQVTPELMKRTGNPKVKFMHCLPAFHNSETKVGRQIAEKYPELANGIEVTEEVFESPMNIAFDQAENRMHTIKAVMVASLA